MFLTVWHYVYFLALMAVCVAAVQWRPQLIDHVYKLGPRLTRRAFFSSPQEWPKFAVLRIALGIIITWRWWDIWLLLTDADHANAAVHYWVLSGLLGGLAITFGLFTQYVFLFLMLLQWQFGDKMVGTTALGDYMAGILSLLLILTNAGRLYSFDAMLLARRPGLHRALLYYAGTPSAATLDIAKLLMLYCYWLLCTYSLMMHLDDVAWMGGSAGPLLLANNFMSLPYDFFARLQEQHAWAVFVARLMLWGMLPWYFLTLPGTLAGGWWRGFVIIWGILFFLLSKFVLQIGWVSETEFAIWAALFWSRLGIAHPQSFAIAYDDTCNLCDRTVQFVRAADIFDRVKLMPASKNKAWLKEKGVSYAQAMKDLHGMDLRSGRIAAGYDFYLMLTRQVVLLWLFYPFLLVGKMLFIGPLLYRIIARYRKKIFGVCKIPSPKRAVRVIGKKVALGQRKLITIAALHVGLIGLGYAIMMLAPYTAYQGWSGILGLTFRIYGVGPIDVFNETDLKMAEHWFTLSWVKDDGEEIVLPILAEDGSRLRYHRSDRIYFGNTLMLRRMAIYQPGCLFENELQKGKFPYLAQVFLEHEQLPPGRYHFRFRQYYQKLPDTDLVLKNRFEPHETTVACTRDFDLSIP